MKDRAKSISTDVRSLIVVADLHCGCRLGLCPPHGAKLDSGGTYSPSALQRKVWNYWRAFWDEWVPLVCRGEPYAVCINGDLIDGVHHNSTTQISHNLDDQAEIAYQCLVRVCDLCGGRFYVTRGTESHAGISSVDEERLSRRLGAVPNSVGQFARHDLWIRVGKALGHILHHIGSTSSSAHEASAVNAELTAEFVESARWGEEPPDFVVRSHRHRCISVDIDSAKGYACAIVTPGWQGKTPFTYRMAGARVSPPQFGGIVIRQGDEEFYYRRKVWTIGRSRTERV